MKKRKYVLTKLEYLKNTEDSLKEKESFNEALKNDVTWGDSLVGRLLASIFRMAKMGSNIVSIKRYINQLDNIISEGITRKLIENDSSIEDEIIEFQNSSIKNGILEGMEEDPENSAKIIKDYKETYGKEAVEDIIETIPEELKTIFKQVTTKSAENIQEQSSEEIHKLVYTFLKNLKESIDKKDILNNQEYKIFKSLESNNITDKKIIDEYNNIIKGLKENTKLNVDSEFLEHLSINNRLDILSHTEKVLEEYKKVLGDNAEKFNDVEKATEYFELLKNYYNNIINQESKALVKMFLDKSEKVANTKLTLERQAAPYLIKGAEDIKKDEVAPEQTEIELDFSDPLFQPSKVGNKNFNNVINDNETHLQEAYDNLVNSIKFMESGKDKYPVTSEFVGELISDFETKKEDRKYFYELFYMICDYLDGVRTGVSEPGALYESVEEFNSDSNKGTMSKIAETIARFIKRSEQFKGEGLYGAMGDLGKHISAVNNSIDGLKVEYQLNGVRIDKEEDEKVDTSNVEFSSKDKTTKVNGEEVDWSSYKDKEEDIIQKGKDIAKKAEKDVEKIKKDGFDVNFIKVLRVFQKAHRIMVVNNIPSVRSGGKVTVQRSNNWEPLGNNTNVSIDGSSSGPFRNKKLFNIWNKGVLDIIDEYQDSLKYASLVADKANETTTTVIKKADGSEQTISKAKDTAVRLKPKTTLLEFMASALDDNKLFASIGGAGGEGYQAKYLKAYMGYDDDSKSSIGKDNSTSTDKEETKWIPSSGFNISYNPYKISASIINEDGVKRPFEMYLLPITSRDGRYLYKMSQSDDFLESYIEGYKKKGPNVESGGDVIRFVVFDSKNHNIKYGDDSEPFKYVKAKGWADGTVFTGYITDIKKIDRYKGNAKWNGLRKDYDIYPSKQSIDEIVKKLT